MHQIFTSLPCPTLGTQQSEVDPICWSSLIMMQYVIFTPSFTSSCSVELCNLRNIMSQNGKSNKDETIQDGTIQLPKGKVEPEQTPRALLFCLLLTRSPLILILGFLSPSVYNPSYGLAKKMYIFVFHLKRSVLWSIGLYTFDDIFWTTACFILLCADRTKHRGNQNRIR